MSSKEKTELSALIEHFQKCLDDSREMVKLHSTVDYLVVKYDNQAKTFELVIQRLRTFQHHCN